MLEVRRFLLVATFALASACGENAPCFTDFCVTSTEAIRQVDWIAVRLLERHSDGVAPEGLEDALGMRLPEVLPAGGTLTPLEPGDTTNFRLTLPNGRELLFEYGNKSQLYVGQNAMHLGVSRFMGALGWCSWNNSDATWTCGNR